MTPAQPNALMRLKLLQFVLPLCLSGALVACGDEVTSTAADPAVTREEPLNPWERLSPEEIYGATGSDNIRLTEVEIDVLQLPRGWDGMRIAAISDLQLGMWEDNEKVAAAAVQRALAQEPDLIVLLGDYLAVGRDTEALTRALSGLRGQRVLAVLGDRDVRNDSVEARVRRTMSELGIQLLVNDAAAFERNGDTAWIAGLAPDLDQRSIADQEFIVAVTGGPITPILLTHSPFGAARAPEGRRPVIIAGNAFCGRVEVPGTPRLSWYESEALPNAAVPGVERLYRIRNNTMFITCGVGYSFIPMRLGAPPEVAMITLRGMMAADQPAVDPEAAALDTILQRYDVTETPSPAGQN
ncbi:hypothetical protein BH23GEM6_BH23GEM6_05450 [soil metagenome]